MLCYMVHAIDPCALGLPVRLWGRRPYTLASLRSVVLSKGSLVFRCDPGQWCHHAAALLLGCCLPSLE